MGKFRCKFISGAGMPAAALFAVASLFAASAGMAAADAPASAEVPPRTVVAAGPEWAELPHFEGIRAGTALDFSATLDAPAGKYGFARNAGGHIEFEGLPGVPQRFYGANLCFGANFVEGDDLRHLVDDFARMGYNIVRLHHYDGALAPRGGGELDPAMLARLDALAAAFKGRGIYITLDLYTLRRTPALPDASGRLARNDYKALVWADGTAEADFLAFATNLLCHVNPHTGLAWKDDPAIIDIDLVNEDSPEGVLKADGAALRRYAELFGEWLGRHPGLAADPPDVLTPDGREDRRWKAFLVEFFTEAYSRIVGKLRAAGVRQMISDLNYWTSLTTILQRPPLDIVENHFYWRHPKFPGKAWGFPAVVGSQSSIPAFGGDLAVAFRTRLMDKPFLVTEFDYPVPNPHAAEGAFLTGAYAALQDWSGLVRFAWAHSGKALTPPYQDVPGFFNCAIDPLRRLSEIAAILFFRRGDVRTATNTVPFVVSAGAFHDPGEGPAEPGAAIDRLGLVSRTGTLVIGPDGPEPVTDPMPIALADAPIPESGFATVFAKTQDPAAAYRAFAQLAGIPSNVASDPGTGLWRSETGELELVGPASRFRAVTPRSEAFLLEPGDAATGDVASAKNAGDAPCAVLAAALDDKPLAASGRILLLGLSQSLPAGCAFSDERCETVVDWGTGPMLVRRLSIDLALRRDLSGFTLYPLFPDGTRLPAASLPAPDASGATRLRLDTARALAWELVME